MMVINDQYKKWTRYRKLLNEMGNSERKTRSKKKRNRTNGNTVHKGSTISRFVESVCRKVAKGFVEKQADVKMK